MRLIGIMDQGARFSVSILTDMTPVDFYRLYMIKSYGTGAVITNVMEVSELDAKRLTADGLQSILRKSLGH